MPSVISRVPFRNFMVLLLKAVIRFQGMLPLAWYETVTKSIIEAISKFPAILNAPILEFVHSFVTVEQHNSTLSIKGLRMKNSK